MFTGCGARAGGARVHPTRRLLTPGRPACTERPGLCPNASPPLTGHAPDDEQAQDRLGREQHRRHRQVCGHVGGVVQEGQPAEQVRKGAVEQAAAPAAPRLAAGAGSGPRHRGSILGRCWDRSDSREEVGEAAAGRLLAQRVQLSGTGARWLRTCSSTVRERCKARWRDRRRETGGGGRSRGAAHGG